MNYQILKRKSFWLTGCIFLITAAAYAPLDADNGNQTMTVGTFQIDSVAAVGEVVEIPDAQAVIEYDSAVGQYGFHLFAEAQAAWNEITVSDPEGNTIFEGKSSGLLAVTGLMNILIETVEPPIDEQSREEFLARYVAGEYSVRGTTVDGEPAEGTITFTHNIPEPPQIIFARGRSCDQSGRGHHRLGAGGQHRRGNLRAQHIPCSSARRTGTTGAKH